MVDGQDDGGGEADDIECNGGYADFPMQDADEFELGIIDSGPGLGR